MVKGFLKGGLIGAAAVTCLLLGLYAMLERSPQPGVAITLALAAALVGGGLGGVVGAVRAVGRSKRWVLRPRARLAAEVLQEPPRGPAAPALHLTVSAIYALALSSLVSLLVFAVGGRGDVTRWVGAMVPFDVTPVHARVMFAGTLFLAAFALVAAPMTRREASAAGLGPGEQRVVAGAGFLAGLLALPSLAVIFG